jgi:hypothetical protein
MTPMPRHTLRHRPPAFEETHTPANLLGNLVTEMAADATPNWEICIAATP